MKILLATDGSQSSLRAVQFAIRLIDENKASGTVTLISVHDDTALRHAQRFVGKQAVDEYLRDLSDQDLAQARELLDKAGVRHDMVIRHGHIAAEIAAAAGTGGFDMIVMGSKGRSALKDLLVGSVAQRVVELSEVPVLLVR